MRHSITLARTGARIGMLEKLISFQSFLCVNLGSKKSERVGFMVLVTSVIWILWLTYSISYFGFSALTSRASRKKPKPYFPRHFVFIHIQMRLRTSYKLFEALKMKTDSCSWWPVSTVDDFFGVCRMRFKCNFKLIGRKTCWPDYSMGFWSYMHFFCIVSSFRISRFTSNSCIFGERALKDVDAHWCAQRDSYENILTNFKVAHTLKMLVQSFSLW